MSKEEQMTMHLVDITYIDLNKAKTRPVQGEIISPESITEQSGYIEPKRQIEDMIMAGRRLDEARKNQYDFESEESIDEAAYDPTRAKNFDLSDASQMQFEANERLREQRLKASQTAQEALSGASGSSEGGSEPPPVKGA